MITDMSEPRYSVPDLLRVMQRLRDPDTGCPWDLRQDFQSIVPSTLEECYELAQAIESNAFDHVEEELGDVLFQVVFYAQLGAEQELFCFESVVDTVVKKLLRRHPHVFANGEIEGTVLDRSSIDQVAETWESIKQQERKGKQLSGLLADIPLALPALPRAQKVQKRAAQINFDWTEATAVLSKLQEEIAELVVAMTVVNEENKVNEHSIHEEMGDVLFTCVNLARHLGLDAEETLRHATGKFEQRIHMMEVAAQAQGESLSTLGTRQLDDLWESVKHHLRAEKQGL